MSKEKIVFAKLVELDEHQVLITKVMTRENDKALFDIELRVEFQEFTSRITFGFLTEKARDRGFEIFGLEENCKEWIDKIIESHILDGKS